MSNVNFIVIEREVGKTGVTELKFGTCAKTQRETQTSPKQTVRDIINVYRNTLTRTQTNTHTGGGDTKSLLN